jgi:hypothetical protein
MIKGYEMDKKDWIVNEFKSIQVSMYFMKLQGQVNYF